LIKNHLITNESIPVVFGPSVEECQDLSAMVYGFSSCYYNEVAGALSSQVSRIYSYELGKDGSQWVKFLSGSSALDEMNQDDWIDKKRNARWCKTALVKIVLKNVQNHRSKKAPLIPVVFCIDRENNPYPFSVENLLSKTKAEYPEGCEVMMNELVTHAEIRRAYKLCFDPSVDLEVRQVAQETFRFVRVERKIFSQKEDEVDYLYDLTPLPAPWKAPNFENEWNLRKAIRTPSLQKVDWREQLRGAVKQLKMELSLPQPE